MAETKDLNGDTKAAINDSNKYMKFEREGGGQIHFNLYKTNNANELKVIVSKYSFRDTTLQIILEQNSENASAFSSFNNAINNKIELRGDFKQSTMLTGTWAYIYVVTDDKQTEVTNIELRNSLLFFEQLVVAKIQ